MSSVGLTILLLLAISTQTLGFLHNNHHIYAYPHALPRANCQAWCYRYVYGLIRLTCCSYQAKFGTCPNTCLFKHYFYDYSAISCISDHNCPGNYKCCRDPCVPRCAICKIPVTNTWTTTTTTTPSGPDPIAITTATASTTSTTSIPSTTRTTTTGYTTTDDTEVEGSGEWNDYGIPTAAFMDDEDIQFSFNH